MNNVTVDSEWKEHFRLSKSTFLIKPVRRPEDSPDLSSLV